MTKTIISTRKMRDSVITIAIIMVLMVVVTTTISLISTIITTMGIARTSLRLIIIIRISIRRSVVNSKCTILYRLLLCSSNNIVNQVPVSSSSLMILHRVINHLIRTIIIRVQTTIETTITTRTSGKTTATILRQKTTKTIIWTTTLDKVSNKCSNTSQTIKVTTDYWTTNRIKTMVNHTTIITQRRYINPDIS